MKLLLFILGLTLCASLPTYRLLQETSDSSDFSDLAPLEGQDGLPRWLFTEIIVSEEDNLAFGLEEEVLALGDINEEFDLPRNYESLENSEIVGDSEVQDAIVFGVQQVLSRGIASGKIPPGNYDISNVGGVGKRSTATRNSYRCDVEIEGDEDVVVNTEFTVHVDKATGEMTLGGWTYQAENVKFTIDESAYVEIDKAEAESNPEVRDSLNYAIKEVVQGSGQYSDVDVNAVYRQVRRGIVYYKFDVTLNNSNNTRTVKLIATVSYRPESGVRDVKAYNTSTTTRSPRNPRN